MSCRFTRLRGIATGLLQRQPITCSPPITSLIPLQRLVFASTSSHSPLSPSASTTTPPHPSHPAQPQSLKSLANSPLVLSSENLVKRQFRYTKPADITPLKEASSLYATIHLYNRKFLVTEGDKILLPVSLKEAKVGDVLNFDQVSLIGSRDYSLTGNPRIDSKVFSIKGVVVENTRVKRSVFSKSKRRRRHVRHVVSKNALTVIRVSELKVNQDYVSKNA